MRLKELPDPDTQNQDAYDDLMVAIAASNGALSLLIAVCDDYAFREQIISRYETELQPEVRCYRLELERQEPSLWRAIAQTVESDEYLQQGGRAVFTVIGADSLLRIHLRADESGQTQLEKFLGYLQWTREGLREFRYPIVLWVTYSMLAQISTKSPDFWSWRKGVFRFTSSTIASPISRSLIPSPIKNSDIEVDSLLSLEDLQNLVDETEKAKGNNARLLATLYEQLAQFYKSRIQKAESINLEQDFETAVDYFKKAIDLETDLDLKSALLDTLTHLGLLYQLRGQFQEAIHYHESSLALSQQVSDRQGEANALGNLGNVYQLLGQYQQATEFHQSSLEIKRDLGDQKGKASSLNNLGNTYCFSGHCSQAIEFYQQSLEIFREISDYGGEAMSLGNLGNAYYFLGQYSQAIEFYQQSLEIFREISDHRGEFISLIGLGSNFYALRDYQQAIKFYQRSLETSRQIGDRRGEAGILSNLGATWSMLGQVSEAVAAYQGARSLYEAVGLESEMQKVDQALQALATKSSS